MTNETTAKELYEKIGHWVEYNKRKDTGFYNDSDLLDDIYTALNKTRTEVLEEVECRLVLPNTKKDLIKYKQWWLEVVYKVGTDKMKKKYPEPKNTNLWYGKKQV